MRREHDAPDPAVNGMAEDDDATLQDMPALTPSYDRAPPTIEEQISPFHPAARGHTAPGMAPPLDPQIRSKNPTAPGMAGLAAPAPRIVGAPELTPPDGPTDPDGHAVSFGADGPTDPHGVEIRHGAFDASISSGSWDTPTDPDHPPPARPEVPQPGAPNVLISKSLEMQVSQFDEDEALTDPRQAPIVAAARRRPQPPTEVMLPALKRKQQESEKEGSDWPLVLGLGALALVILGVLVAVVLGVMSSF